MSKPSIHYLSSFQVSVLVLFVSIVFILFLGLTGIGVRRFSQESHKIEPVVNETINSVSDEGITVKMISPVAKEESSSLKKEEKTIE